MLEIKVDDVYDVTIEKQDHFGRGVAKVKNMVIFIREALPGDHIKVDVTDVKKTFAIGKIKEMKKSSEERTEPYCRYYDICGGCQIMHQKYPYQLEFKEKKVKELFSRYAEIDNLEIESSYHGKEFHYRNKVVFHGVNRILGFYKEKSRSLIKVKLCLLLEQELNIIYNKVIDYLNETPASTIRNLMIRKTSINEFMMVVDGDLKDNNEFLEYIKDLNIHSIFINNQLVRGKRYITESIFDLSFRIYPEAFFQVNYEMMKTLYQLVIDYYKKKNYNKILDLYCGTGTIGILLSPYVNEVVGVEVVKDSIKAANQNKEINNITNIRFIEGKVEDKISSFKEIDSIVVDPPRNGLDSETIETILRISPQSIVYISCDPVTLARDLKILLEDYELVKTNLVDMFPNTYHIETVVILERKPKRTFNNYGILVNLKHPYKKEDFEGMSLVKTKDINGKNVYVDEIAYNHYLSFKSALKEEQILIGIKSAYRTYEEQQKFYERATRKKDEKIVSPPGYSDFHTGLSLEIEVLSSPLEKAKAHKNTYKRLQELAPEYGFVLRYPKKKEKFTGRKAKKDQFRYVGSGISRILEKHQITLEEYHNEKVEEDEE